MKMLKNLLASLLFAVLTFTATAQTTQTVNVGVPTDGSIISVTSCTINFHASGGGTYLSSVKIWRTGHTYHVYSATDFTLSPTDFYYPVQTNDSAYKVYATNGYASTYVSGSITYSCNGAATGIKSIENTTTKLSVFPNPSNNLVQVTTIDKANLIVFTTTGQVVITATLNAGTTDIDVSKLTSGLYYVKVGDAVSKLIKE